MTLPEIIKGSKLAKSEAIRKAKGLTDEERDSMSEDILKKYSYHQKIAVLSTILSLKFLRREKEEFINHIYKVCDCFNSKEKTRLKLFCRMSIKEIKGKNKLKEKDEDNIKAFNEIIKYLEK